MTLIVFYIYSNLHTCYILMLIPVIGLSNFTGINQFHPGDQKEFSAPAKLRALTLNQVECRTECRHY